MSCNEHKARLGAFVSLLFVRHVAVCTLSIPVTSKAADERPESTLVLIEPSATQHSM